MCLDHKLGTLPAARPHHNTRGALPSSLSLLQLTNTRASASLILRTPQRASSSISCSSAKSSFMSAAYCGCVARLTNSCGSSSSAHSAALLSAACVHDRERGDRERAHSRRAAARLPWSSRACKWRGCTRNSRCSGSAKCGWRLLSRAAVSQRQRDMTLETHRPSCGGTPWPEARCRSAPARS